MNFLTRIIRKCWSIFIFIVSIPVALTLIILFPFIKIKFIGLISDRIGHYAMNTELLLCYLDEIKIKEKKVKYLFYTRIAPICNKQLHHMWKRAITIFPLTRLAGYVDKCLQYALGERYKNAALKKFEISEFQDTYGYLQKCMPHLYFSGIEIENGKNLTLALGIPSGEKWVCLLVRDPAYLNKYLPGRNWSYHFYRDCNIDNFEKAALFLVNQGYYVVRMGKTVSKAFGVHHPKIIDYAKHSLRSDFADIYLSAYCEFFISTATGLDAIAQIFRRPLLQVNVAPFKHQLQYWYPCELFITKKVFDHKNQCFLSFKEVDRLITKECDVQKVFNELNLSIIENTQDEILEAVCEIENIVNLKSINQNKNIFHTLLKSPCIFSMIPARDLLKTHPEKFYIKIGKKFLDENKFLLFE